MERHVDSQRIYGSGDASRAIKIQLFQRATPKISFQFAASARNCVAELQRVIDKIVFGKQIPYFLTSVTRCDEEINNDSQLFHRCMAALHLEGKVLNVRLVDEIDHNMRRDLNFLPMGWKSTDSFLNTMSAIDDFKTETRNIIANSKKELESMVQTAISDIKKEVTRCKKEMREERASAKLTRTTIHDKLVEELEKIKKLDSKKSSIPTPFWMRETGKFETDGIIRPYCHAACCDVCDSAINGHRYKCVICEDYDLCEECEADGKHSHHALLRIVDANQTQIPTYILDGMAKIRLDARKKAVPKKSSTAAAKSDEIDAKSQLFPFVPPHLRSKCTGIKVKNPPKWSPKRDDIPPRVDRLLMNKNAKLLNPSEMLAKLQLAENQLKAWNQPAVPTETVTTGAVATAPVATAPVATAPVATAAVTTAAVTTEVVTTLKDKCLRKLEENMKSPPAVFPQKEAIKIVEPQEDIKEVDLVELTKAVEKVTVTNEEVTASNEEVTTSDEEVTTSDEDDLESLTSFSSSLEDFEDHEIEESRQVLPERLDTAIEPTDEEEGLHTAVAPTPEPQPVHFDDGTKTAIPLEVEDDGCLTAVAPTPEPPRHVEQAPVQASAPVQIPNLIYPTLPIRSTVPIRAVPTSSTSSEVPQENRVRIPVASFNASSADVTASALLEMGFSFTEIQKALTNVGINVENCVQFLLHKSF